MHTEAQSICLQNLEHETVLLQGQGDLYGRIYWSGVGGQVNSEKETEKEQSERYFLTQMCFWQEDYKYAPGQMVPEESME